MLHNKIHFLLRQYLVCGLALVLLLILLLQYQSRSCRKEMTALMVFIVVVFYLCFFASYYTRLSVMYIHTYLNMLTFCLCFQFVFFSTIIKSQLYTSTMKSSWKGPYEIWYVDFQYKSAEKNANENIFTVNCREMKKLNAIQKINK